MPITIEPTMIKQSCYLLVPKSVAELIEIKNTTKLSLIVKKIGDRQVLEYEIS